MNLKVHILLPLLLLAACVRPSSDEIFVKCADRDERGRFCYVLDMDDSLCAYTLTLSALWDINDRQMDRLPEVKLGVRMVSPEGEAVESSLVLTGEDIVQRDFFSKYMEKDITEDFRPRDHGKWQLYLAPEDGTRLPEGFGIRLKRKWDPEN